jgi:hypothetical protein
VANSTAFDFVCEELELRSSLDRLEARGTVRLALKQAGLDSRTTTPDQMKIVCEKILPAELSARGVDGLDALSCSLIDGLGSLTAEPVADSPDTVFQRLGGGA